MYACVIKCCSHLYSDMSVYELNQCGYCVQSTGDVCISTIHFMMIIKHQCIIKRSKMAHVTVIVVLQHIQVIFQKLNWHRNKLFIDLWMNEIYVNANLC